MSHPIDNYINYKNENVAIYTKKEFENQNIYEHMVGKVSWMHIEGLWRRNTTLKAGKTWNISSVVGLVAPKQLRRSFLAYSESEETSDFY